MKITKEEILAAIKAEKVFNPHEIAEISAKVQDVEVLEYSYRETAQFVRNWGYETIKDPAPDTTYLQLYYTITVYRLKVATIIKILEELTKQKMIKEYEQSRQTNLKA